MAIVSNGVDLGSISSALATIFQDNVVFQGNRSTPLLQLLPHEFGRLKNLTWDAELADGQSTSSVLADGSDVANYYNDTILQPVLNWGTYSEAFALSGKALSAAIGVGNPAELASLLVEKMDRAITRLTQNIATDIYLGTANTSDTIWGLTPSAGGMKATGSYAGLDRSTYPLWAGNELLNGGVARALSITLMRDMRRSIYVASGLMPDLIVCDPIQFEKYGLLFGAQRSYRQDVYLRGQKITLDGGFMALDFDGIPVIQDKNCPAGKMLFINTKHVKIKQLTDAVAQTASLTHGDEAMGNMIRLHGTSEEQLNSSQTALSARVQALAMTGDAFKVQLICYPQVQVERPNCTGILGDLQ